MKNIFRLMTALMFMGCSEDYLDKSSLTQLSETSFWKTEQDAILALNGVYENLQSVRMYGGTLNGYTAFPMYDNFSDNGYNFWEWEGAGNYVEGNADSSLDLSSYMWDFSYTGIGRANVLMENLPNVPEDKLSKERRDQIMGQALFLRALYYSNLAVYFEDVPLVLSVQTLEESYVPKNTYDEVSAQIVQDLTDAIGLLPTEYSPAEYGYATKGAALGLLGRFQLYNKNYQAVIDATQSMLGMGYGLHPDFAQLFTEESEYSNEIVFAVRFLQDPATENGERFSATYAGIPKVDAQPMPNLIKDFYAIDGLPISSSPNYDPLNESKNRDPRLTSSVYFVGDIYLEDTQRAFKGNTATKYGQRKYIRRLNTSPSGVAVGANGGQDFYLIRFADILLMRAEALVETGQLAEVYNLVNQVRTRAGMPTVESVEGSGLGQDRLREVVRHERRVELAFEGVRFFDLKRWDRVSDAYQRMANDNVPGYAPSYRGGRSETFPIPQSDLDANKNLTQSPTWQ